MAEFVCDFGELHDRGDGEQVQRCDKRERITRCRDCKICDTMECPIKRALVADGQCGESDCVAPGGFCAWARPREDA